MKVLDNISKCLVLTNYRSGSTEFCEVNADISKGIINLYEILHDKEKYSNIDDAINVLKYTDKFIVKMMPDQFNFNIDQFEKILKYVNEIIYLYRKDYKAQCLSWIACKKLKWTSKRPKNEKQAIIDIDQRFADTHSLTIKKNNDMLGAIYKKYPGPIYAYEDIQNNNPYAINYIWKYKPYIGNYDTNNIFKEQ